MAADRPVAGPPEVPWSDIPDPLAGDRLPAIPPSSKLPDAPSPTRSDLRSRRLMAFAAGVGVFVGSLTLLGARDSIDEMPVFVWQQSVLWGALFTCALYLAATKGRRGLGAPARSAAAVALAAPLIFMVVSLLWRAPEEAAEVFAWGPLDALRGCLMTGVLVAVVLTAIGALAFRRSFPAGAVHRGAALGAACGLGAALVSTLHCGVTAAGHVALAHGLPIALAAMAGALVAPQWLRS